MPGERQGRGQGCSAMIRQRVQTRHFFALTRLLCQRRAHCGPCIYSYDLLVRCRSGDCRGGRRPEFSHPAHEYQTNPRRAGTVGFGIPAADAEPAQARPRTPGTIFFPDQHGDRRAARLSRVRGRGERGRLTPRTWRAGRRGPGPAAADAWPRAGRGRPPGKAARRSSRPGPAGRSRPPAAPAPGASCGS